VPPPARSTLIGYAAIAVIVVALGLRWLAADARTAAPASSARVAPSRAAPGAAASDGDAARGRGAATSDSDVSLERAPAPRLVVHVVGAVRRPGVYTLREGSRVADAVRRAGGVAQGADTVAVNLAAKLIDGQQVALPRLASTGAHVPRPTVAGQPTAAAPVPAAAPVSLGSATLEQLDTLDGVGPATAKKILAWRDTHGGVSSVDELGEIPGIGPKKLESLRAQVVP